MIPGPCLILVAYLLGQPVLVLYSPMPHVTLQAPVVAPAPGVPVPPVRPAQAGLRV